MSKNFNLLDKHEFMQQYVLNRALAASTFSLCGLEAGKDAEKAWNLMLEKCKGDKK